MGSDDNKRRPGLRPEPTPLPDRGTPILEQLRAIAIRRRQKWEREWQVESQRPEAELATAVPTELKQAVQTGWISPGSKLMDIGCGRGQISAWLAQQGFAVLGVDLAQEAIQLARRHFASIGPHLEFRTLDICAEPSEPGRFDALVDRGCFHGLPTPFARRYVRNVAIWAKPGGRLLLFSKVGDDVDGGPDLHSKQQSCEANIRAFFEPVFEITRVTPTTEPLSRSVGPLPRRERPGMVFWMTRR
jgi:cyclopropane fatty-acyl-phospholipid synthase-like methyltransferase